MAFLSRVGSILKQSMTKQITSHVSASNLSTYQSLRCMSSSKLFSGGRPWGAPQQYGGGRGDFNSDRGFHGVAGVGNSYFGGGAAGTNVTAESGFRSSGFKFGSGVGNIRQFSRRGGVGRVRKKAKSKFRRPKKFISARARKLLKRRNVKKVLSSLQRRKRWLLLLKTKAGCRLLLKSRFLQKLHSTMQAEDLRRTKNFEYKKVCLGSKFAEFNRMKRNFYQSVMLNLSSPTKKGRNLNLPSRAREKLIHYCSYGYKFSVKRKQRRKTMGIIKMKRLELPTHYLEINYRTLKAVVYYGPDMGKIYHIPLNIRLKAPVFPRRNGKVYERRLIIERSA